MSSNLYGDRPLEELRAIVDRYNERYKNIFGVPKDPVDLLNELEAAKLEAQERTFVEHFGHLKPGDLATIIKDLSRELKK